MMSGPLIATWMSAISAFGSCIAAFLAWGTAARSNETAARSLEQGVRAERAILQVVVEAVSVTKRRARIDFRIRNDGRTVAHVVGGMGEIEIIKSFAFFHPLVLTQEFDANDVQQLIPPGGSSQLLSIVHGPFSPELYDELFNRKALLFFYGRIFFTDYVGEQGTVNFGLQYIGHRLGLQGMRRTTGEMVGAFVPAGPANFHERT